MSRVLSATFALLVLAVPAFGAGSAAKPEPGTTVEMPYLLAPMSQDGKLLGYAYISSKLVCGSQSACFDVREKLAFIQDAFVRDVNARPVSLASDPTQVDRDLLNARLTADAKRIVGDSKVLNMVFADIKYAPLQPTESTAGVMSPAPAANGAAAATGATNAPAPAQGATQSTATPKPAPKQTQ